MKDAKDTVGLGIASMVGLGVTGTLGKSIPGSSGIQSSVATGLNLANIGQTGKVGLGLSKMMYTGKYKK